MVDALEALRRLPIETILNRANNLGVISPEAYKIVRESIALKLQKRSPDISKVTTIDEWEEIGSEVYATDAELKKFGICPVKLKEQYSLWFPTIELFEKNELPSELNSVMINILKFEAPLARYMGNRSLANYSTRVIIAMEHKGLSLEDLELTKGILMTEAQVMEETTNLTWIRHFYEN
tara:strand:- start:212 stop:748 length:537 start_codon:yes stop_codon:yes gene_type:complete